MKNSEEKLSDLHELVTESLLRAFKSGDIDEKTLGLTMRFLKDNNVTSFVVDGKGNPTKLGELAFVVDESDLFDKVSND